MSILQLLFQFGVGWRPDLASLLIGLALGVLLLLAWRRIWPTLSRWGHQLAGRLQQSLAWARSGTEVRFRSETAEYVQQHHLGKSWATIDQVFVMPQLLVPPREFEPAEEADRGAGYMNYLWPELVAGIATPFPPTISLRELLLKGERTILSAPPGAGKSTLLAYSAYRCATALADGREAKLLSQIPVFVHLAELESIFSVQSEASTEMDPAVPLVEALRARSTALTSPGIKDMLSRKLQTGQVLLLLDGWNELTPGMCTQAREWLSRLLLKFPKIQVIAAAPLTGYGPLMELDFTLIGLLPWRTAEVEILAERWTEAFPLGQPPALKRFWRPGQSSLESCLRLWLLATSIPPSGRQYRSVRRITDLMISSMTLFDLDSLKTPTTSGIDEITVACWQRLAYALIREEKLSLSKSEVRTIMQQVVAENSGAESDQMPRLQDTITKSSMFVTWANGRIGFLSSMWRDFLAASYIAQHESKEVAAGFLNQPHRTELLRFYIGRFGATELANELLSSKEQTLTRESLFQVASWMPEAPDSGEWRRQTMILLGQIIRQASFANVLRLRAVAALAQSCESGVLTFLLQLLERSNPFLRQIGAAALPAMGADNAIGPLTQMLKDSDPLVRQAAVYSLAWLADPAAEHPLLMALISGDVLMNRIAAAGLAGNGAEGVEILHEAVEDNEVNVRRSGIHGLSLANMPGTRRLLTKIERNDPEWMVRSAATEALEQIGARSKGRSWQPLPVSRQRWLIRHATQERRGVPEGAATLPFLVQALAEASQTTTRVAAATSLGQLAAHETLPALETALRDNEEQVREAAFIAMAQIYRAYGHQVTNESEM